MTYSCYSHFCLAFLVDYADYPLLACPLLPISVKAADERNCWIFRHDCFSCRWAVHWKNFETSFFVSYKLTVFILEERYEPVGFLDFSLKSFLFSQVWFCNFPSFWMVLFVFWNGLFATKPFITSSPSFHAYCSMLTNKISTKKQNCMQILEKSKWTSVELKKALFSS